MDLLGIIGAIHIALFMFYVETITIRLDKKFKRKHLLYYVIVWTIALFPIFFGVFWAIGARIDIKFMIYDIVILGVVFLIIDYIAFRVCLTLYQKFPFFRIRFGHDALREKWRKKREQKG